MTGVLLVLIVFLAAAAVLSWTFATRAGGAAAEGGPKAKNVIVFVGDGMGPSTITAARWYKVQNGPGGLYLDTIPHTAAVRTESRNGIVTDSAAAATALFSGRTTENGMINRFGGESYRTVLEDAQAAGKATGVVTTANVTHATPSGTYARVADRSAEGGIALQLLDSGIDVAMGGGIAQFIDHSAKDPESGRTGARTDGRDLIAEFRDRGYTYVNDSAGFFAIDPARTGKLLGLFEWGHMNYEADRKKDRSGEPCLNDLTAMAIRLLSKCPDGYFLMVEGGRIDQAHHETMARKAIEDTIELDRAVRTAAAMVDLRDTLIIVVADHSHTMTINGYPSRETDILGLARDSYAGQTQVYPILSYAFGPRQYDVANASDAFAYDAGNRTPDTLYPGAIHAKEDRHGGEMVIGYAIGPGAEEMHGTLHLTDICRIARKAMAGQEYCICPPISTR